MEYFLQALKVLRNLVHSVMNAKCPKTGIYAVSLIQTRFLCVITEIRKQIPKGPLMTQRNRV